MNRWISWLLSLFVAIFAIGYVSVMAYRYNYSPYKTETAIAYSMDDSHTARVAILRSEVNIPMTAGVLDYRAANGEMVLRDDVVADVFSSQEDYEHQSRIMALTQEIENLSSAQNSVHSGVNTVNAINNQVEEQLSALTLSAAYGRVKDIDELVRSITYNINRKLIATGQEKDFTERIAYLESEKDFIMRSAGTVRDYVKAPETGYFSSVTDGFEEDFSAEKISTLDVNDVARLIMGDISPSGDASVGKIVTTHNYYVAALIDSENIERFMGASRLKVSFPNDAATDIDARVIGLYPIDSGEYIAYMRLSNVNDYMLSQRRATVSIKFSTISGIRVSSSAVRFVGTQAGVYVLGNGRVIFKPILIVHEEPGFVICKPADAIGVSPLRMYDQVITYGTDLYDGKVVG